LAAQTRYGPILEHLVYIGQLDRPIEKRPAAEAGRRHIAVASTPSW
jgi:hypothetical protein